MRKLLNGVALVLFSVAVILVYGYWPRESRESEEEPIPDMPVSFLRVHAKYPSPELSPELETETEPCQFEDNFDYPSDYQTELQKALRALEFVESKGDPSAVGDRGLTHKAYGVLQIRQPYLTDVNKLFKSEIRERWGKSLMTKADTKDPDKARWMVERYLVHYGDAYARRTGKEPTAIVYARIHNGGPEGWRRASTNAHARKVEKVIERMNI